MEKKFSKEAVLKGNIKWEACLRRERNLYARQNDIRTEFNRDYNRILHCNAYRRLKHKTQVFFATHNDHICTRIEHVQHVAAIAYSISDYLGLNTELTLAIATGHDLGHAPFGHQGEIVLSEIISKELNEVEEFWHEKNGLYFVDNIELLESPTREKLNLNLTYGVRDGIISHCGEVDQQAIKPREEAVDLTKIKKNKRLSPYTWEASVVKIADKIAYLGRDIEDAMTLQILNRKQLAELITITKGYIDEKGVYNINNTVLIHKFINSICANSNVQEGIYFTDDDYKMITQIKDFNYEYIYKHPRLDHFKQYVSLVINTIYKVLSNISIEKGAIKEIQYLKSVYPKLGEYFGEWLKTYSNYRCLDMAQAETKRLQNKILYNLEDKKDYMRAIIDFIAGMSDEFAIQLFEEITTF